MYPEYVVGLILLAIFLVMELNERRKRGWSMKTDNIINELKKLPSPEVYARSYAILHEAGHWSMMKILRLPILKTTLNFHNNDLPAYITYIPRNRLDMTLVVLAGIFYPPIAMLKYAWKAPPIYKVFLIKLAKDFLKLSLYNLIHIYKEHLKRSL